MGQGKTGEGEGEGYDPCSSLSSLLSSEGVEESPLHFCYGRRCVLMTLSKQRRVICTRVHIYTHR